MRFAELPLPAWALDPGSEEIVFCNASARLQFQWSDESIRRSLADLGDKIALFSTEASSALGATLRELAPPAGGSIAVPASWRTNSETASAQFSLSISHVKGQSHELLIFVALDARPEDIATASTASVPSVCRSISHELNNISASLRGFIDLADEVAATDAPERRYFAEQRLSVARLTSLANTAESLAAYPTRYGPVAIGDCIDETLADVAPHGTEWSGSCPPTLRIHVDQNLARMALRCLHESAAITVKGTQSLHFAAEQQIERGALCTACGQAIPAKSVVVFVRPQSSGHLVSRMKLPLRTIPSLAGLMHAALVHNAHLAGGHLIAESSGDNPGITFPAV